MADDPGLEGMRRFVRARSALSDLQFHVLIGHGLIALIEESRRWRAAYAASRGLCVRCFQKTADPQRRGQVGGLCRGCVIDGAAPEG